MSDIKAAQQLIERSLVDLSALEAVIDHARVADEVFGFLAQQAVEKALKAHLAMLDIEFPITHHLERLVSALEEAGEEVPGSEEFSFLTPFAVQFRYEGLGFDEALDRRAVLKSVQRLVARVKKRVDGKDPGVSERRAVYGVKKRIAHRRKSSPNKR